MKCPYCKEWKGNNRVRGYPVKDQLHRHIEISHRDKYGVRQTQEDGRR